MSKARVIAGSLVGAVAIHVALACSSTMNGGASSDGGIASRVDAMVGAVVGSSSIRNASAQQASGAPAYVTVACNTSSSSGAITYYWATQNIVDKNGNPMPAAAIEQLVSATDIESPSTYGNAAPAGFGFASNAIPTQTLVQDGSVAALCTLQGDSILFSIRPQ